MTLEGINANITKTSFYECSHIQFPTSEMKIFSVASRLAEKIFWISYKGNSRSLDKIVNHRTVSVGALEELRLLSVLFI